MAVYRHRPEASRRREYLIPHLVTGAIFESLSYASFSRFTGTFVLFFIRAVILLSRWRKKHAEIVRVGGILTDDAAKGLRLSQGYEHPRPHTKTQPG